MCASSEDFSVLVQSGFYVTHIESLGRGILAPYILEHHAWAGKQQSYRLTGFKCLLPGRCPASKFSLREFTSDPSYTSNSLYCPA